MTGFSLKLKTKKGQHVLNNLDEATTIGSLKTKVAELTQIREFALLVGFPPKPLDLTKDCEIISSSGIASGDTLIVEEKANEQNTLTDDAKLAEEEERVRLEKMANEPNAEFMGILLKKVVPADNSCLFTSVGYVLKGEIDTDCGTYMRGVIAEQVASDSETYSDAFLGKPNREYCDWIRHPDSWGGAIEVSILSNFYGLEIDVVDITNAIINRFGEDKNFGIRVFLLFDGIHYDPLYLESLTGGQPKTLFPVEEMGVYQQAEQLALEAKSSRQFTDVDKFTLRCISCDTMLTGQVEAQYHARTTGHTNFGEV